MRSGWIKLHVSTLDNKIWKYDQTAWRIFEYLMLSCDYKTGQVTKAHSTMIDILGIPKSTLSRALLRLENAKMVNRQRNSNYTLYTICNWSKYQGRTEHLTELQRNSNGTQTEHIKEIKNKEVRKESLVETQSVYDLYVSKFHKNPNTYRLTDKRRAKIRSRLKDAGAEMLRQAINNTAASPFHTGDNDRGWSADLDFIIRSYEQVEKLAAMDKPDDKLKPSDVEDRMEYVI